MIALRILPQNATAGWLCRLVDLGANARYRHGPFGRLVWLLSHNGETMKFSQGQDTALNFRLPDASPAQHQMADLLVQAGVAVRCPLKRAASAPSHS